MTQRDNLALCDPMFQPPANFIHADNATSPLPFGFDGGQDGISISSFGPNDGKTNFPSYIDYEADPADYESTITANDLPFCPKTTSLSDAQLSLEGFDFDVYCANSDFMSSVSSAVCDYSDDRQEQSTPNTDMSSPSTCNRRAPSDEERTFRSIAPKPVDLPELPTQSSRLDEMQAPPALPELEHSEMLMREKRRYQNRSAASRCRKNRHLMTLQLREEIRAAESTNSRLKGQVRNLHNVRSLLLDMALRHNAGDRDEVPAAACTCIAIHEYNRSPSHKFELPFDHRCTSASDWT